MSKSKTTAASKPSTDGRMLGMLSIAASPAALLISPMIFSLAGFFLSLLGLTIAAPEQRVFSIAGLILALSAGAVGYAFDTTLV